MKRLAVVILVLLAQVGVGRGSVCYPSYSSVYYAPVYKYHCAGYWNDKYYPAGWYYWDSRVGAWYLKGYGYHYGIVHHVKQVIVPVAAFFPQPVYFGTWAGPSQTEVPQGTAGSSPSYAPSPAPAPSKPPQASVDTKLILGAIERLGGRIETLEGRIERLERKNGITSPATPSNGNGNGGEAPPPSDEHQTALNYTKTNCASCHTEGKTHKDTKFVMITKDGNFPSFSKKVRDRIAERLEDGTMPPPTAGKTMPQAHRSGLVAYFKKETPTEN